jgi:predicted protein tyrosine phosphatase
MDDMDNLPKTPDIWVPGKTDLIFDLTAPYANPYQGVATRILFVCSAGMLRSPTAADVATRAGYNARSCGSSIEMALIPLSVNLIMWAEKIVFMNSSNKIEAAQKFFGDNESMKRIDGGVVWHVEDVYDRDDPTLRRICEEKLDELFDTN